MLFVKRNACRGDLPIGVHYHKCGKYVAQVGNSGKKYIGLFTTPEEAFTAYKKAKEELIQETAIELLNKREIDFTTFYALMAYEVEITD